MTAEAQTLLHQELISTRSRVDRQFAQLQRLNELTSPMHHRPGEPAMSVTFSEAIADILDMAVGAAWILDPQSAGAVPAFAACGVGRAAQAWEGLGTLLEQYLRHAGSSARWLPADILEAFTVVGLADAMACRCVGRNGKATAIVMAANTINVAANVESVEDGALEMLALIADRCADHIDSATDNRVIESQMARLRESEERLEMVLRGTRDGWWDWDIERDQTIVSSRWLQMLGDVDGRTRRLEGFWADRIHVRDRGAFDAALDHAMSGDEPDVECEVRVRRGDGGYLPVLVRASMSHNSWGQPTRLAGSILDLTDIKRSEERVHQLAFYDALTALPNRRLLLERLDTCLSRTGRELMPGLVMIDLDRFKVLNDTHGHGAGDEFLRLVAGRLTQGVRTDDTVARLGGDEFVILLEGLGPGQEAATRGAQHVAEKLLSVLAQPYQTSAGILHHTASIGVAVADETSPSPDALMKRADLAMYEAKAGGRNLVRMFTEDMQVRIDRRAVLETRLREDFALGTLGMHYQAQVNDRGELCGAEALMRWQLDGVHVTPTEFIAVAEDSGLIHELGAWGLGYACEQVVAWEPLLPEGFRMAVNVSATEFMHDGYAEDVAAIIARVGIDPTRLRLEITEAHLLADLTRASACTASLRAMGVEISLDDFGTGYSSLSYLRQLPVDEVKIDYIYVSRYLIDPQDAAIVRAVTTLAKDLGIRVVAEGVESLEVWQALRDIGCDTFQGHAFGYPKPAEDDPNVMLGGPVEWVGETAAS